MGRTDKILSVKNLSLELGEGEQKVKILRDISLDIAEGETISVTGPSGSGKTSLMMIMSGLLAPTKGKITYKQDDMTGLSEDALAAWRQKNVGIVFQNFHLIPTLSALENVAFPLRLAGRTDAVERAREKLRQVGLSDRAGHLPSQLSGGEQQRVALARALVHEPEMILADEPTGNLDSDNGQKITTLLFDMVRKNRCALVLITHDETLAQKTDRTLHLVDGRFVA